MAEDERKHMVIFPLMAQGHIIPFLALAFHIEQKTRYTITLVNTPLNIKKLRSSLPANSSIILHELPFSPSDHGLPPEAENTDVLPYPLIISLIGAASSLKPSFSNLISKLCSRSRGVCIISDMFLGWTVDVAREFGSFHAIFSGAGGFGLGCYYSVWWNKPHKKALHEFSLPDFQEAGKFHVTQLATSMMDADGTDPWSEFHAKNLPKWLESDGMLFNTVEELDFMGLNFFRRLTGKHIWPIGPVVLTGDRRRHVMKDADAEISIKQWLDCKEERSVLYISFGSNNTISASHMMRLAMALEKSGKNFIWVVRPPLGFDINSEFRAEEWLPEGFNDRMGERGIVLENWAPQLKILSHGSVCAFLSHCGWNSVLESLSQGVVMIGWPMNGEQFFNVKLLEEKMGVCVEVARGTSFDVRQEDLLSKIDLVMGNSKQAVEMRKKAREVKETIQNAIKDEGEVKGSSVKAMDEFLQIALSTRE